MNLRQSPSLSPAIPGKKHLGPLKDMAQEVVTASAYLEGRIAPETARALGEKLRYLNSYYSNLIEGHKTLLPEIEQALLKKFASDNTKRYAQELCAAHVNVEREFMADLDATPPANICDVDYLGSIHKRFYEHLPEHHRYTHHSGGFTDIHVYPGRMRDANVSVDQGHTSHGPDVKELPQKVAEFAGLYNPSNFHGDEKLIAAAAAHHRLTWLHPFRDGNGRVARLFTGFYLSAININKSNLWSINRAFSREKNWYMINLQSADSPDEQGSRFDQEIFADFCAFFLESCLNQIAFMDKILDFKRMDARIDSYINERDKERGALNPIDPRSGKLLKALFARGEIPRKEAGTIMNMDTYSDRQIRRVVSQLIEEGMVTSDSHRAPLRIGFPMKVLRHYFPALFDPSVMGDAYLHGAEEI
ncbi:MAG: Fic family protein [Thermodesulfobacteriota bacterium]|nr:Fic family protein [Thermodesulfobacteriota bacterium]